MNFKEIYNKRTELIEQFKSIFNFTPSWDIGFMFDLIDLSYNMEVPDNVPYQDFILDRYGVDAVRVVDEMNDLTTEFLSVLGSEQREKPKGLLKSAKALRR